MIDGSWMDDFGTWQANAEWPGGMKAAAEKIRAAGLEPGIWTCPFVVMAESLILEKYPDLVARDAAGEPCLFGYQGPTCYGVDVTAPSAPAYFNDLYGRLRDWGYRYHKLDFLRAIITAENIVFHDRSLNRAQAYQRGMRLIREAAGADAYILACGGLFEGSAAWADAVRTSSDTVGDWQRQGYAEDRPACEVTAKQNLLRNYTARFWHVDPDALMLRLRNEPFGSAWPHFSRGTLTDDEAFTLLTVQYLCGGAACIGERFRELPERRRALLRHLIPQVADPAVALDWLHPGCPSVYLTRLNAPGSGLQPWYTLAVINWENALHERTVELPPLGGDARRWAGFEFCEQRFAGIFECGDPLKMTLPAHGTRVFRFAPWDGCNPVILGTDLHLSGGACELRNIRVSDRDIHGSVESRWRDFPVKVTAAFPCGDDDIRVKSGTVRPGELFRLSSDG
mgnify:CR=1 FL=1